MKAKIRYNYVCFLECTMKFIEIRMKDLFVVEPQVFNDTRGCFFESYNKSVFEEAGLYYKFV